MQLTVFNQLCLICANFRCEEESCHKKYTLKQMETLLVKYFLLQVSSSKKYSPVHEQNFLKNTCQNDENFFNRSNDWKQNKGEHNETNVSWFLRKILSIVERVRNKKERRMIEFEQMLFASLSTIYFLETFDSDPLLFHDILYVIKMIVLQKTSDAPINDRKGLSLPFTQKRMKRTIRRLEGRIDKKTRLRANERTQNYQKVPKVKISLEQLIRTSANLKSFVQQFSIIMEQNTVFEQHTVTCLIHRFLNDVESIQLQLATGMAECQQSRTCIKAADKKGSHGSQFQQEAETFEFAFIEGVPFPKNRRSVDFSILQITDEILFKYLPSLEKFKDLEELCIRNNHLAPISYKTLKNIFPRLKSLDIRQNTITPEICLLITQFKSLNILYLSDCHIQSKSLVEICLRLSNINVLYCDNLVFLDQNDSTISFSTNETGLRGIFYIMALNLKKLMYLSIKGYFSSKIVDEMFRSDACQQSIQSTSINETKQLKIFKSIYHTLQRRHGVVQF